MGRDRTQVALFAVWLGVVTALVFLAGVRPVFGLAGYVAGGFVIRRYSGTLRPESLSGVERALPLIARGALLVVASGLALLLVVTMLAFLVAWSVN
jgi:hypothetical protein